MESKKLSPEVKVILEEMCKRVNIPMQSDDFFQTHDWYITHSWTAEEQDNFIEWLADYLFNHKKEKNILFTNIIGHNKKQTLSLANHFVFNYGWKEKENV